MSADEITVRPGEPADLPAVAEVFLASRMVAVPAMPPIVHSPDEVRAYVATWRLDADERRLWVAEDPDGAMLGFAELRGAWLDDLYVHPDAVGRGIGSTLLDVAKVAQPDGFSLWVFESNLLARTFYAHRGLVELERTDGAGNEERSPDVRMVWPGQDPVTFFRRLIDEVDDSIGDLLARRVALTRAVQHAKSDPSRDPVREREIAERLALLAPELGADRLARIVHAIVTESLDAVDPRRP